jgi:hypothetical protein
MISHKSIYAGLTVILLFGVKQLASQTSRQSLKDQSCLVKREEIFNIDTAGAYFQCLQLDYDTVLLSFRVDSSEIETVWIDHSLFDVPVRLRKSKIDHYFRVDENVFTGGISFITDNVFPSEELIRRNKFNSPVVFSNDTFVDLNLLDNVVNARMEFMNCRFSKTLTIQQLEVTDAGSVIFQESALPEEIYFVRNSKLKNDVDFQLAMYDARTIQICLFGSDISRLKIDYIHFKLLFPNLKI